MDDLNYVLSAYFHQDWNHTYDSWEAVVDDYVSASGDSAGAVPVEIDRLLRETPDDKELATTLIAMGCAYDPPEGDRAWLAAVGQRIRAGLDCTDTPPTA